MPNVEENEEITETPVEEELTIDFTDLGIHNIAISEYDVFLAELLDNLVAVSEEEGLSPASTIARSTMAIFQPGFVIIASPETSQDKQGHEVPSDVAIAILSNTNYTQESVTYILQKISEGLIEASDENFKGFFDIEDSTAGTFHDTVATSEENTKEESISNE